MVRYPDTLSLLKARALFFRDAKLGPDGGYSDRWVRVETKPIPFYFPNWPSRVAAARLHDLHHIATDYETDWLGEAEIAAWEIASGCARYHAAWILNFGAFGARLVVAPRRVFRAFLRGRHTKTNLYKSGFDESRLDDITVGMLRDQLGLRAPLPSAGATDVWLFLVWCIPSVLAWLLFPFLTIILFWLIVRATVADTKPMPLNVATSTVPIHIILLLLPGVLKRRFMSLASDTDVLQFRGWTSLVISRFLFLSFSVLPLRRF